MKVGDIVRLKHGQMPMRIHKVQQGRIWAMYLHTVCYPAQGRPQGDFVPYETPKEKAPIMTNPIFQTLAEPTRYGTQIATDSQGRIVLEMKGTPSTVEAFEPSAIKEVKPYTINTNSAAFTTTEGRVKIGDLLVIGDKIQRVTKLDTEANNAPMLPEKLHRLVTVEV